MTGLPSRLTDSLGSNYRLERELGGGGMSRVFLATDLMLGRQRRAFELLGQPDSAIARYEQYANRSTFEVEARDFFLAATLRRLGELYESRGDRAKALEYYGRFVDLGMNADSALQPLVRDVREQMARLSGDPPR